MRITCDVIQDLLPSYVDGLTSEESNQLVESHLKECDICTGMYHEVVQEIPSVHDMGEDISDKNERNLIKRIKSKIFTIVTILFLMSSVLGGWLYNKITDETYEGMSIIPEKHDDIPLYEGLKPRRTDYVIEGDHWREIYDYYRNELPKQGWEVQYNQSALDDDDDKNDWAGFTSSWIKEGFKGELAVSAGYNQFSNQTEVNFDYHIPPKSTAWITKSPDSICVNDNPQHEKCSVIDDKKVIAQVVKFIDGAAYNSNKLEEQDNYGIIKFADETDDNYFTVRFHFTKESQKLYLESNKGIKTMKPDPEFFQITNLTNLMK